MSMKKEDLRLKPEMMQMNYLPQQEEMINQLLTSLINTMARTHRTKPLLTKKEDLQLKSEIMYINSPL